MADNCLQIPFRYLAVTGGGGGLLSFSFLFLALRTIKNSFFI